MDYDRKAVEAKWQKQWADWELYKFDFNSDKPTYSIDTPPPYASGELHMGRATHYTKIDFVARYKRMRGYNVFFPLCADVNGMPIEVRVERKFGVNQKNTSRQKLIELCSKFAEDNIKEMIRQFTLLGESMDPSIYYRTDAKYYRRLTQISFLKMYERGLIYRGEHPVNWCPDCVTALADAEVEYRQRDTKLNYINFKLVGTNEKVTIATTRPELLCTCQLVAINPNDDRHQYLIGRKLKTPIFDREVEVVADEKVDPNFGTGIVMICTIGDKDDLEWVYKYKLPLERGIDEEGRMTAIADKYKGMSIQEARDAIIAEMKAQGILVKQEDIEQNIGTCWRCHTPIEFLQVKQWFLKTLQFKEDVLRIANELNWYPEFMKIRLQNWVESLTWDWVLSRQRYFATAIPMWLCENCDYVLPAKEEQCYIDPTTTKPHIENCPVCGDKLKGCEDVFDTWMDSSITPFYNSFWARDETKFKKMFPLSLRPQASDIIRTWAFYTILRTYLLTGDKPWTDIMIDGYIMAPDGRPMHTSLGNIIDPLPVLEEYGADPMRYYAATCTIGVDVPFRRKEVVHGRKLCTKLWNVEKFIGKSFDRKVVCNPKTLQPVDRWILSKYSRTVKVATEYMDNFLFDKALKETEYFLWHELADHYLEMVKYRIEDIKDEAVRFTLYNIGLGIAKLFAPFLSHITEEIYQRYYRNFEEEKSVHISKWPEPILIDEEAEIKGELVKQVINGLRNWKAKKGLPLSAGIGTIELIITDEANPVAGAEEDIVQTLKAKGLQLVSKKDIHEEIIKIKPVYAKIGPTFKEKAKEIIEKLNALDPADASSKLVSGKLVIELKSGEKIELDKEFIEFEKVLTIRGKKVDMINIGEIAVAIEG